MLPPWFQEVLWPLLLLFMLLLWMTAASSRAGPALQLRLVMLLDANWPPFFGEDANFISYREAAKAAIPYLSIAASASSCRCSPPAL